MGEQARDIDSTVVNVNYVHTGELLLLSAVVYAITCVLLIEFLDDKAFTLLLPYHSHLISLHYITLN